MNCAECARFSELLNRAEQTNQAERGVLAMNAGTASPTEWQHLFRIAEEARLRVQRARVELEQHQQVHRTPELSHAAAC